MMRFVIPAGRARPRLAAVAGVLVLGWLSGLGPADAGGGHGTAVASGPRVGAVSARKPGHRARPKPKRPAIPKVDCRVAKCVALTFDDGPGPYTTKLLGMLAARHARATFFLIGGNVPGREGVVRQELAQGHAIGNHTWSHPDLSTLPKPAVRSQLTRTLKEITKVTGRPTRLMRPPYGATDNSVGKVARTLGLAQITWSVDTDDWRDRDSAIVARRAISWTHRGDIILMHDIHPTTVNAVPKILRGLAKRGFTFVTVPELLSAHPVKPGKVYLREEAIRAPHKGHPRRRTATKSPSCTGPGDNALRCVLARHGIKMPAPYVPHPPAPGRAD